MNCYTSVDSAKNGLECQMVLLSHGQFCQSQEKALDRRFYYNLVKSGNKLDIQVLFQNCFYVVQIWHSERYIK